MIAGIAGGLTGNGDAASVYIAAAAGGNAVANNQFSQLGRLALRVCTANPGLCIAGGLGTAATLQAQLEASIQAYRDRNPNLTISSATSLAYYDVVVAPAVRLGFNSVTSLFASADPINPNYGNEGYGAGVQPSVPRSNGFPITAPVTNNNTGGDQIAYPNPDGNIVGGGYGADGTPNYGTQTTTPSNVIFGSTIVLAVPAGDQAAINNGLYGAMGDAPLTVRPGTNVISEYPNGTKDDANRVFDNLPLSSVRAIQSGYGNWGRTGTLPDGTQVTVRPSQDGRPTIQIVDTNRPSGSRTVGEIRFGSN